MALNPNFVIAPSPQTYFVDKTTGFPLANGKVYFYSDVNRSTLKPVYTITGSPPNYNYVALPNPITLSSVGTFIDGTNNDITVYYKPYDSNDNPELYYIRVYDQNNQFQFDRPAWPNYPISTSVSTASDFINFIPNPQFLLHNNIPANVLNNVPAGRITSDVTNIAPGDWYFSRSTGTSSIDNVTFFRYGSYVANPTGSPRYAALINCQSPNPTDLIKNLSVRFKDVNKFSSNTDQYTFSFNAITNLSGNFTVNLEIIKNFGTGGSPSATVTTFVTSFVITNTQQIFQHAFSFGSNQSYTLGSNNDDYVEIAIKFPTNISFGALFTDFILTNGNVTITSFPPTTNSDFLSRSLVPPTPDPNGNDLNISIMSSPNGYNYNTAEVGDVVSSVKSNKTGWLLCDGSSYFTNSYFNDGVPCKRLFDQIFDSNFIYPKFGTGINFVTGQYLHLTGSDSSNPILFFNTNNFGTQTNSFDVGTGFDIETLVTGSTDRGFNSQLYVQVTNGNADGIFVKCKSPGIVSGTVDSGNISVLTVSKLYTQNDGSRIAVSSIDYQIVSLVFSGIPSAGQHFNIATPTQQYYVWYKVNGSGSDPAQPGIGILVNIKSGMPAREIAYLTACALNGFQNTYVKPLAGNLIPNNSYFEFFSNSQRYYVWYDLNNTGTDPSISNAIGIKVGYSTSDDARTIGVNTLLKINSLYYSVPDLRGYVIKGSSENSGNDYNVNYRYSNTGLLSYFERNQVGSYQLDYLLSHTHELQRYSAGGTASQYQIITANNSLPTPPTLENIIISTGTSQNDVKNVYLNYFIKY